jgi:hypothetical protein
VGFGQAAHRHGAPPDASVRPTTRRLADETNAALKAGYLAAIGAA